MRGNIKISKGILWKSGKYKDF